MKQQYEIGKFYEVPCVEWIYCGRLDWWPVLGPRHEDGRIIKFKPEHYHVDARFLTGRQYRYLRGHGFFVHAVFAKPICEGTFGVVEDLTRRKGMAGATRRGDPPEQPTMKRRQCLRTYDPYPHQAVPWMQPLEDAYECAKMVKGICPHQGAPLDGLQVVDGVVTCPLHGLRWDVATGALVRTTKKPEVAPQQLVIPLTVEPKAA